MPLTVIANQFSNHLWTPYEPGLIESVGRQITQAFGHSNNLLISLTWFGPQFYKPHPANAWAKYLKLVENKQQFDRVFLLCAVDPAMINRDQIADLVKSLGNPELFLLGNFDSQYRFNFFAPILSDRFVQYTESELLLTDCRYLYINYNRKPRQHRVELVKKLIDTGLVNAGIVTLGKPNRTYDNDPDNTLYLEIGEQLADYVGLGQTDKQEDFGLPDDILSLHNMTYWRHHFLNVIGATEFNPWDDIFVSETQFKPLIGLRPYIINGNTRTYQWLRDNGFHTFNHYFSAQLEDIPEYQVHDSIIAVLQQLQALTPAQLVDLYNRMLPELRHNRQRFFEFAQEQRHLTGHLFDAGTT